ncbi:toluene hydroxylase [Pseudonocardia sp. WMMC193]|uniref:toluene hydroxylase n=1 Tax=Pseudonocardia sp. WMMC193 TaxID=2911965 RepID=UPI001F33C606|nr:toluene hydroxylase [Pseudonocardia sp. WMMC193]MCF7550847.1 toluene hydroxylase [Pseudonocardia sp. WMMC193]
MTTPAQRRRAQKTWSMFGQVKRKPTPYEAVTGMFHSHFRHEPAPFEMDPATPINLWYLKHREGSPFQVDDWEGFRDPYKLTYKDYVALQHEREIYVDGLIDRYEVDAFVSEMDPAWLETLRGFLVPLRFPLHVLQITSLYVGQMAPSSYITNCANFQAADEMRRIQRIAYWTRVLANAHGAEIAETDPARRVWCEDPNWQPLREALETALIAYDWGEAFVALNLALKPAVDAVVNGGLGALALANGDQFVGALCSEFALDSRRSRDWSRALALYAIDRKPEHADLLGGWVQEWRPRADAAVAGLAQSLVGPTGADAAGVVAAVRDEQDAFLAETSL